jgi:hypothetical protein
MIKASLLLMLGLTVLVAMTLRWRERHYPPAAGRARRAGGSRRAGGRAGARGAASAG